MRFGLLPSEQRIWNLALIPFPRRVKPNVWHSLRMAGLSGKIILYGNELPWVNAIRHLGSVIVIVVVIYFIEPLSGTKYIIFTLYKRLIRLIQKIGSCKKDTLKTVLRAVKHDCDSTTGGNRRKIMLMVNKHSVDEIQVDDLDQMQYRMVPCLESWYSEGTD